MKYIKTIINKFRTKHVVVVGDIILDQYIQGSVSRISPEAPVPVVLQESAFCTPGGAASVAHNLRELKAKVSLLGKVGDDKDGEKLISELNKKGIITKGIVVDKKYPTISKLRVMAQKQQIVRVDREEISRSEDTKATDQIISYLKKNINEIDAIVISDYGKGLISSELVSQVCSLAQKHKKILTVDPKVEHFGYYQKVTAITPNKNETANAIRNIKLKESKSQSFDVTSDKLNSVNDIDRAGKQLLKYLDLDSLLITLGADGMRLYEKGKKPYVIKTKAKEVFDVTGAGDTVISVFTLCLTVGATKKQAAEIANVAAGIVVGQLGAVAISLADLQKI